MLEVVSTLSSSKWTVFLFLNLHLGEISCWIGSIVERASFRFGLLILLNCYYIADPGLKLSMMEQDRWQSRSHGAYCLLSVPTSASYLNIFLFCEITIMLIFHNHSSDIIKALIIQLFWYNHACFYHYLLILQAEPSEHKVLIDTFKSMRLF